MASEGDVSISAYYVSLATAQDGYIYIYIYIYIVISYSASLATIAEDILSWTAKGDLYNAVALMIIGEDSTPIN